jgi:hypothetical protein
VSRIVETDNFGGDYPNEKFLLWPMPEDKAKRIADAINDAMGDNASRYWKVVPNDYKLQPGFQP